MAQNYKILRELQTTGEWATLTNIDLTVATSAFYVYSRLEVLLSVFDKKESSRIGLYTHALQHLLLFLNKKLDTTEGKSSILDLLT